MIEYAQNNYPNIDFANGVLGKLPFPDNSFDAIFALEVFRYLNTEEQEKGYKECLRVLRPGGTLIVTLVNKYALDGFYFKYKFTLLLEKLGIRELPNYCDFKTPLSIKKFLINKLGLGGDSIKTTGVMFAPVRLAYKLHRSFGEWFARRVENFDKSLTHSKWHQNLSG